MIGSGFASAIDTAFVSSPTIHGCVLVFNRPANHVLLFLRMKDTNPSSITCANPSSNHQGTTTVLLPGVLVTSPLGGDYGKQLDVNNIIKDASHPNASPFPLADLNVSIQSGSYASARCFDADRTWNLQTKFTYNDNTTQTLNSTSACLVA